MRIGPWGDIRQALESGEIDAISGMFYSEECDKSVDFSPPYSVIHHAIFVRRDGPAIETEEDLRGKEIIVMRGDIMHDYVRENGLNDKPVLADTQADALRLLSSGKHDCALVANLPGLYWARELELSNIVTVGPVLHHSDYCYAVMEGNAELQHHFGEGLATLGKTGAHKSIYDKWLGVLEPRGIPRATVLKYAAIAAVPLVLILAASLLWTPLVKKQVVNSAKRARSKEQHLDHLNRVLTAIRNVNRLIVAETNPKRLIERVCANLTETLGYYNAWIALTDETGAVTVTASSGFHDGFGVMRKRLERGEFSACMRRALTRNELVVVHDPPVECLDCPLSLEYASRAGLIARLVHGDRVYGVLTVSVPGIYAHDAEEQQLFSEVASDLAFALCKIEDTQALLFATSVINSSPAVAFVWESAEDWPVRYVSENVERLCGFTAKDFVSGAMPYANLVHPADLKRVAWEAASSSADRAAETVAHTPYRIVTQDGDVKWVECMTTIQRAEDGHAEAYCGILLDITDRKQIEHERDVLEEQLLQASEREQQRIGRDLHDGLGQYLTSIAFMSAAVSKRLGDKSLYEARTAAEIQQLANEAVRQSRLLAKGLCPVGIEEGDLKQGMLQLTRDTEAMFGISCYFECDETAVVHDSQNAIYLYRIAQESISNAVRHGRARNVELRLERKTNGIALTITDDGVGIPEKLETGEGMGIQIMKRRAKMIGAFLDIRRAAEGGTIVRCLLTANEGQMTRIGIK